MMLVQMLTQVGMLVSAVVALFAVIGVMGAYIAKIHRRHEKTIIELNEKSMNTLIENTKTLVELQTTLGNSNKVMERALNKWKQ